jgi:hypothetical protein
MKYSILAFKFLLAAASVHVVAAAPMPAPGIDTGPMSSYLALHPVPCKDARARVRIKRDDEITGLFPSDVAQSTEPGTVCHSSYLILFSVSELMVSARCSSTRGSPSPRRSRPRQLANLRYLDSPTRVSLLLTVIFQQSVAPNLVAQPEPPALDSYSQLIGELLY